MTGSFPAAVFLSHLTLAATWLFWATLYRALRADWLRMRLRQLQFELETNAPPSIEHSRLSRILPQVIASAGHLTLTRLLLCFAWARFLLPSSAQQPSEDGPLKDIERRLTELSVAHACGGLRFLVPLILKCPASLDLMFESCLIWKPEAVEKI